MMFAISLTALLDSFRISAGSLFGSIACATSYVKLWSIAYTTWPRMKPVTPMMIETGRLGTGESFLDRSFRDILMLASFWNTSTALRMKMFAYSAFTIGPSSFSIDDQAPLW